MRRPENHATRAMAAIKRNLIGVDSYPLIPRALIERLEKDYPPRCRGLDETELEHQEYAGMVKLVQTLRAIHTQFADFGEEEREDQQRILAEERLAAASEGITTTIEMDK